MSDADQLAELLSGMEKLLHAAWSRGYAAGAIAMRENIVQAAQAPMAVRPGTVAMAVQVTAPKGEITVSPIDTGRLIVRAPRGAVPNFIRRALTLNPGQTATELAARAKREAPEVAWKSVGNQLRRFDGKLYERDGYRWYLLGQKPSAAPVTGTADIFSNADERR